MKTEDNFNAVLRTSGKTALALVALLVGGGSFSVVMHNADSGDPALSKCEIRVARLTAGITELEEKLTRSVAEVRRLEPFVSDRTEVSSMVGAGTEK